LGGNSRITFRFRRCRWGTRIRVLVGRLPCGDAPLNTRPRNRERPPSLVDRDLQIILPHSRKLRLDDVLALLLRELDGRTGKLAEAGVEAVSAPASGGERLVEEAEEGAKLVEEVKCGYRVVWIRWVE
jgi:hypothetical protein